MSVSRCPKNPIITIKDVKPSTDGFEVIGTFNAGVARFKDEVILLLRVAERPLNAHPDMALAPIYDIKSNNIVIKEFSKDNPQIDFSDPRLIVTPDGTYLTSISHFRLARSTDGVNFEIDDAPAIAPASDYETFGLEDPRIAFVDGLYYITYVAVSPSGVTTCLISTDDFKLFNRHGVIFCPDNKDVVIFPEKIDGSFHILHRPASSLFGVHNIWLSQSPDMSCWGSHRYLMGPRCGFWDDYKIGAGAVPFKINAGWLEIYHGADRNNRYCLGAVLLDSKEPWKVLARSKEPILQPEADYECEGFFGNVVFTCGLLYEADKLKIYYGAADCSICYAQIPLQDVLENLNL